LRITCSSSGGAQTAFGILRADNISWPWHGCSKAATVSQPPEDEQVMLETCRGPWFSTNWMKSASRWFHCHCHRVTTQLQLINISIIIIIIIILITEELLVSQILCSVGLVSSFVRYEKSLSNNKRGVLLRTKSFTLTYLSNLVK
jgi:hypothetical protein